MNDVNYSYKKGKLYARLVVMLVVISVLFAVFTVLNANMKDDVSYPVFGAYMLVAALYTIYKIIKYRRMVYFLKSDDNGVYTHESFVFCPWNNIKNIDLRRYMGYQTIFFEVKETNLDTKIKPVHKDGKTYYCLPLADCAGNPKEVLNKLKRARKKAK